MSCSCTRKTVFKVMDEYIERCKQREELPIVLYDWLEYLGATVKVSHYHTISCFQNVRHLGGILFETIEKNEINNKKYEGLVAKLKPILKQYEYLFR